MQIFLTPLKWLYSLYAHILFIALMFLIFPFVILFSFLGRIKGGNMILRLCMIWADIWFFLILIFPKKIFEAPHDKTKQYVFVNNHISYLDSAVLVKAYRQPFRPLGKVEITRIPFFGFIYRKAIVPVDRRNAEDRAESIRILKSINSKGISVMVFPEGTFNMTPFPLKEFYDGAFRLAIETQTPIKPVLFPDTYSRMNYKSIFAMTPGKCRIIYLNEISVDGLSIGDLQWLKQHVYSVMENKLIEYKAAWIKPVPSVVEK